MRSLHKLTRWYAGTMVVNLCMLVVIIRIYAEPFSLVMDPFSWLGKTITNNGSANTAALLLFTTTLFFNAFRWRQALDLLSHTLAWRFALVRFLSHLVLAGFFLMVFPCDRFDAIHSTGSGFVIGGLWALTTIMLFRFSEEFEPRAYILLQLILHSAALFCGVNFILDSVLKGFSQRPLLLAIITVTSLCLKTRMQSYAESGYAKEGTELSYLLLRQLKSRNA